MTSTKTSSVLPLYQALRGASTSPRYGGIPASRLQPVPKPPWYDHMPAQGKLLIEEVRQGRTHSLLLLWNGCVLAVNHCPHGVPDADGKRKGFVVRILKVPPAADQRPAEAPKPTPRPAAPRPRKLMPWILAAVALGACGLVLGAARWLPPPWEAPAAFGGRVDDLERRVNQLEKKLQDDSDPGRPAKRPSPME